MTTKDNTEILKEIDNFIEQAKLEGEISGSSASLTSIDLSFNNLAKVDSTEFNKTENKDTNDKINEDISINEQYCTCDIEISKTFENQNTTQRNNKVLLEEEGFYKYCEENGYKQNWTLQDDENQQLTFLEVPQQNQINSSTFNNEEKLNETIKTTISTQEKFLDKIKWKQGDESCETSYIDLGHDDSIRSKVPYVMWLQEKRSKLSLNEANKYESNSGDEISIHQVNSALFWERWMDYIFEAFDKWFNHSSESDNEEMQILRTHSVIDFRRHKIDPGQANSYRTKSEPLLRGRLNESSEMKTWCDKYPSYVDWLIQKRKHRKMKTASAKATKSEIKKTTNYWWTLYEKLLKSLSSILTGKTKTNEVKTRDLFKPQSMPQLITKSDESTSSLSENDSPRNIRKVQSYPCSRHNGSTHNRYRYKTLNQDLIDSPVLTDQLVELVCNTLKPDSSEESSESDGAKRQKCLKKRRIKRI